MGPWRAADFSAVAGGTSRAVDRDAAFKSDVQSGHGAELRKTRAKTFLIQFALRRLFCLPWAGPKAGLRSKPGRTGQTEVAGERRNPPLAPRWKTNDRLLQSAVEGRGGEVRAEPRGAVFKVAGFIQAGAAAWLGRNGDFL